MVKNFVVKFSIFICLLATQIACLDQFETSDKNKDSKNQDNKIISFEEQVLNKLDNIVEDSEFTYIIKHKKKYPEIARIGYTEIGYDEPRKILFADAGQGSSGSFTVEHLKIGWPALVQYLFEHNAIPQKFAMGIRSGDINQVNGAWKKFREARLKELKR